jgi:hypothetical protein
MSGTRGRRCFGSGDLVSRSGRRVLGRKRGIGRNNVECEDEEWFNGESK